MLVTKEGKLFGKINIVDLFVIFMAIVVMIGVYFKFIHPRARVVTTSDMIEYVIKVKGIRQSSVDALMKGGEIVNSKTEEWMGTIVNVEIEPFYDEAVCLDGSVKLLEVPNEYSAKATIRLEGKVNDRGYYTQKNKDICVGSTSNFSSKYIMTSGDIISVSVVEGEG